MLRGIFWIWQGVGEAESPASLIEKLSGLNRNLEFPDA
jgi:hypothetical protein